MRLAERSWSMFFSRLLRWMVFGLAIFFVVGASIFPEWWKSFFFGRGFARKTYWQEGLKYILEGAKSFSPLGALILSSLLFALVALIYNLGRSQSYGSMLDKFVGPPGWLLTLSIVAVAVVFASLLFVRGEYWDSAERRRHLNQFQEPADYMSYFHLEPPATGVYLYLNRTALLDQYAAVQEDLVVTSESLTEGTQGGASGSFGLPGGVGVNVEKKGSRQTSVTRSSPSISASLAARRLINRFRNDKATVQLVLETLRSTGFETLKEDLAKRGVTLTPEQLDQLDKGDRELFERETFKAEPHAIFFYQGTTTISFEGGKPWLRLVIPGHVAVIGRGPLDRAGLSTHLEQCSEQGKPSCVLSQTRLFGVIVSRTSKSPSEISLEVLPLALW